MTRTMSSKHTIRSGYTHIHTMEDISRRFSFEGGGRGGVIAIIADKYLNVHDGARVKQAEDEMSPGPQGTLSKMHQFRLLEMHHSSGKGAHKDNREIV